MRSLFKAIVPNENPRCAIRRPPIRPKLSEAKSNWLGMNAIGGISSVATAKARRRAVSWIAVVLAVPFSWLLLGAGSTASAQGGKQVSESESGGTSLTALREQTRDLLRKEALLKNGVQKDAAVTALCDLYVILRKDSRYAESEMLQQDAGKIRRRLLTSASKQKGRLRRERIPRPTDLSQKVDTAVEQAAESHASGADSANVSASLGQSSSATPSDATDRLLGGQAAGGADNGWQLVELIERIVEPDFWETAGGPGSIQYFAMRRLLVVRATSDVHEQIRELLLKLPR